MRFREQNESLLRQAIHAKENRDRDPRDQLLFVRERVQHRRKRLLLTLVAAGGLLFGLLCVLLRLLTRVG